MSYRKISNHTVAFHWYKWIDSWFRNTKRRWITKSTTLGCKWTIVWIWHRNNGMFVSLQISQWLVNTLTDQERLVLVHLLAIVDLAARSAWAPVAFFLSTESSSHLWLARICFSSNSWLGYSLLWCHLQRFCGILFWFLRSQFGTILFLLFLLF